MADVPKKLRPMFFPKLVLCWGSGRISRFGQLLLKPLRSFRSGLLGRRVVKESPYVECRWFRIVARTQDGAGSSQTNTACAILCIMKACGY